MDTISKTHSPEKGKFLVQVIRLLLICIKQLNHLPPEIRGGDYIGRLDHDSFAIILEDVDMPKARGRANDILHSVASLDIMLNGPSRTHRLRATISIGVAVFALGDSVSGLLKRAEMAMRKAKAGGKNQVAVEGRG